jgi:hypothetical protein
MSADVKVVRILLDNGRVAEFPIADVTAVEFTPRKAPPAPAPDPAKDPAPVTVPAGTVLNVLLTQAIDVDATPPGMTFQGLLDDPVMLGGKSSFLGMWRSCYRSPRSSRPATSKGLTRSR